ncbi:hypothetical protein QQS21_004252 [Conoideocrella luteorostrata]|uniref:Uncharacterized protein n=1 Tax=Conoideocrella luteorostrata TaxID=1105319 RepID=A0AAJ0CUM2_9HYPO|nr:hypothetical protein QQS21_004252 [Conoideocrella luteorostrata]
MKSYIIALLAIAAALPIEAKTYHGKCTPPQHPPQRHYEHGKCVFLIGDPSDTRPRTVGCAENSPCKVKGHACHSAGNRNPFKCNE